MGPENREDRKAVPGSLEDRDLRELASEIRDESGVVSSANIGRGQRRGQEQDEVEHRTVARSAVQTGRIRVLKRRESLVVRRLGEARLQS
jgi:hypothetical protein